VTRKEKENTALRFVVANAELNNSKRVELIVESAKKHVTTLGATGVWENSFAIFNLSGYVRWGTHKYIGKEYK